VSNLNHFQIYLKKLSVFTIVIGLLYISYINLFPGVLTASKSIAIFIVIFIVTSGGHYLFKKSDPKDPQKLIVNTLLSIVLKLVSYAVFAIILIVSDKPGAIPNITLFFILYLIYTVFDIYHQRTSVSKK